MFAYCLNNPSNLYDPSGKFCLQSCRGEINLLMQDVTDFRGGCLPTISGGKTAYDKDSGLIHNQTTFEHNDEPVGLGKFASSGCAIIATYNAIQLLGGNASLGSIRDEYLYLYGSIAFGLGGVGPWCFDSYFVMHGYSCSGYTSFSSLNANISEGDVVIFTVMNNKNDITKGFHTMAAQYVGGIYRVYNAYGNSKTFHPMNSLDGYSKNCLWIYGYIVGG